jgi:group I intron endonuclease
MGITNNIAYENIKEQNWCVYIHTNKINNKAYIGITQQKPEHRWQNGYGYKNNKYFWRSIKKYGWDNFEHIIFAKNLTQNEAEHIEILLIALYDTTNSNFGYNISIGGVASHTGVKHSKETKEKISEKAKERFIIPENNPFYGKKHTEESKIKIGDGHRNPSDETRKKMSESAKKRCTDEWKIWQRELAYERYANDKEFINGRSVCTNNPMYGKKHSKESKEKMTKANRNRKEVYQFDKECNYIATYNSIREASKITGISRDVISRICNNGMKLNDEFLFSFIMEVT